MAKKSKVAKKKKSRKAPQQSQNQTRKKQGLIWHLALGPGHGAENPVRVAKLWKKSEKEKRVVAVDKYGFSVKNDKGVELVQKDALEYLKKLPDKCVRRVNADFFLGQQYNPLAQASRGELVPRTTSRTEFEDRVNTLATQLPMRKQYTEGIIKNAHRVLQPGGTVTMFIDFYEVPLVQDALEKVKFDKVLLKRMTKKELSGQVRSPTGRGYLEVILPRVESLAEELLPKMQKHLSGKGKNKQEKRTLDYLERVIELSKTKGFSFTAMPWKLVAKKAK